ncbi:MAG: Rha family transcriptional regulator [Ruminococcus sp.]|nr:Rha family transcriptional regulator [Ruminococcus sp.]
MIFLNEIKITNKDGRLTVSSLQVATDFKKRHSDVCEAIETLIRGCAEKSADLFIETKYQQTQNKQWYKCYDITRDGFSLLVMGFTGKKALEWKLKYIEAFNLMEQKLTDRNVNLEEVIAKAVAVDVSETIKALVPLMKMPAPEVNRSPDEPKRIRKPYRYATPSKISMLEPELKQKVDEMIISGEYSCQQIANFIMNNSDIEISQMAVNRYKRINFI